MSYVEGIFHPAELEFRESGPKILTGEVEVLSGPCIISFDSSLSARLFLQRPIFRRDTE
jgi:hypothetical protein